MKDVTDATKAIMATDNKENIDNEDILFLKSLAPILQQLPPRENRLAKIRMQQILFKLEFGENVDLI